ncbi:hypothetical protein GN958_ATG07517 [Phytophthora infestans]|uniref:Uncharacterized protein n=1 Tax=Phytophthora infestans TaxID=4787 RepID=A0A8S9UW07_PHYIN|nr:hypothetical protein GN958_ATG07517 [Phytophthora infestans]
MAIQVMPLPPPNDVTVIIDDGESSKDQGPAKTHTLQQSLLLGALFTIMFIGALYLFVSAIELINDGFICLLEVAKRQHRISLT